MRKFAQSILPGLLVLGLIIGAKPACAERAVWIQLLATAA